MMFQREIIRGKVGDGVEHCGVGSTGSGISSVESCQKNVSQIIAILLRDTHIIVSYGVR